MPSRSPSPSRGRSPSPAHSRGRRRSQSPVASRSSRRSHSRRSHVSLSRSRSRSHSRSRSRTPGPGLSPRRNGHRDASRSPSRSRSPTRSLSRGRSDRRYRDRSYTRSPSRGAPPRTSSKIVVEKLTKNVNENHLREIFGVYGEIQSLELPMNPQFMTNRGTAYILYYEAADAEAAISHMHEAQLDGLILGDLIDLHTEVGDTVEHQVWILGELRHPVDIGLRRRAVAPHGAFQVLVAWKDMISIVRAQHQDPVPRAAGHLLIRHAHVPDRLRHGEGHIPGTAPLAVGDGTLVIVAIVTGIEVEVEVEAEA
ncbi:hypothetical protein GX48_05177 [Paracoccidioides brasiliensis]|nr:hypothetical protein GX48_05177 [Paracoccidioides brasiliensis]